MHAISHMNGIWGMAARRRVFVLESVPTILLGLCAYCILYNNLLRSPFSDAAREVSVRVCTVQWDLDLNRASTP